MVHGLEYTPLRVDRVDVHKNDDTVILALGNTVVHALQIRLRYSPLTGEVINSAGAVVA